MLPVMTSIHPCSGALRTISILTSDAALIFPGFGVDANLVAFVDERPHLHDETGLERRLPHLGAHRRTLDAVHRFLGHPIDGPRPLRPDPLVAVEPPPDQP